MKRALHIALVVLALLSLSLVAFHKPGAEKPMDEFTGTLSCVVKQAGELLNRDGFKYYKDRVEVCTLTSSDDHVDGTMTMTYIPWGKSGKAHSYWVHIHLDAGAVEWVGYAWGTTNKAAEMKLHNGWLWTPEAGHNITHLAFLRFEMPAIYGQYEQRGN